MEFHEGDARPATGVLRSLFPVPTPSGSRAVGLVMGLAVLNAAVWVLAFAVLGSRPVLLGSAGLAYWLGWRHAFDADHIAAIDNVTRRLVSRDRPAMTTGLFFSLGHSSVVFAVTILIALTTYRFRDEMILYRDALAPAATLVSAGFLLLIGVFNLVTLVRLVRRSGRPSEVDPVPGGVMGFLLKRLASRVEGPRAMFPIGVLFGLGFDTATEIALLGIAAAQAAHSLSIWSILIFPALFTAGMAVGDTLEGLFMLSMYRWTTSCPRRRRSYDIGAVAMSVVIATAVAMGELAGLAPSEATTLPTLAEAASFLEGHSEWVGLAVVALFGAFWALGHVMDRSRAASAAHP